MLLHNHPWLVIGHNIAVSTAICPHWLVNALTGHDASLRLLISNNVVELKPLARRRARLSLVDDPQAEK